MALVYKDRVLETSTTTGTGAFTLAGTLPSFQSFAAIGDGNTCYYTITAGSEWEVGLGTYTASGTSLSRDVVLDSSNSGSLVNFAAGTKTVFVTIPADVANTALGVRYPEHRLQQDIALESFQSYIVVGPLDLNGYTLTAYGRVKVA